MNVLLTFDVEIWCNSWSTIESDFAGSFERYIYGRSPHGEYGLPKTLEILNRYGLRGVFFVEPLFAARFGIEHLATIVRIIQDAGQEVQLHLHPEWTDEARPELLPDTPGKRQHLFQYTLEEQRTLIRAGLDMLQDAGSQRPVAFRSGGFACNEDTFIAVGENSMLFDSSINPTMSESRPGAVQSSEAGTGEPFQHNGLTLLPMSSFRDGFGRLRHAQIGACSAAELTCALHAAAKADWPAFVLLSHNFELMTPDSSTPDWIVVRRFEKVCRHLADNADELPTCGFDNFPAMPSPRGLQPPAVTKAATVARYAQQGMRRLSG